jgi:hypothetical protein
LPTPPQPAPQDPYPGPVPVVTSHPRIR